MQTKNKLEIEIEGNKEKIFASESIKNIIDFEEAPLNKTNNFVASIDDFSEYPVLSYSNNKFRTALCVQFGHGQEAGLRNVNQSRGRSHNVKRYYKASYDDSCTLSCQQVGSSGNSNNKQNSQTATAGRISGLLAGP